MTTEPTEGHLAALNYIERGWRVVPLRSGQKRPSGSQGRWGRDFSHALASAESVRDWWSREPGAGVGIVTGKGLVVLDVDPRHGGNAALAALEGANGRLPDTLRVRTGSGGWHLYFACVGHEVRNSANRVGEGLDVRGLGGYVVAPPSTHPETGEQYRWDGEHEIATLPEWLRARMTRLKKESKAARARVDSKGLVQEGKRNDWLTRRAGGLRRSGLGSEELRDALSRLNQEQCRPPLPDGEINGILRSAERWPVGSSTDDVEILNDIANGARLVEEHSRQIRHTSASGWLVWDGMRWRKDELGETMELAKETAAGIRAEVQAILGRMPDEKRARAWRHHGRYTQMIPGMRGMLTVASTDPAITRRQEDFDRHPLLFNVNNGTLDLETGQLRPHGRADLLTKLAPIDYDPQAEAPTWSAFLYRIMGGDAEMVSFLQRAVGASLAGVVREHALLFCFGDGANGKSTFLETIRFVLGEYALQADFNLFLRKGQVGSGPTPELARLVGARFLASTEVGEGRQLAEEVVKQLTGGDTIMASHKYGHPFEFKPEFTLWLAANHKPRVRGSDLGIWRRIRLVPFEVTIPEEERDPDLPGKLQAEASGILAWAVQGCLEWLRQGLEAPSKVLQATEGYRSESDVFGKFLEECCVADARNSSLRSRAADLLTAWKDWSGEPLSGRQLAELLRERGFERRRSGGSWWLGIGLKVDPARETDGQVGQVDSNSKRVRSRAGAG
ncbi:MAG: phage/plasmid primase, P4 family [Acidobacteriota bacterium]